jgi:nucleoside 2-deoxyribosyltransferase
MNKKQEEPTSSSVQEPLQCGIVMPISAIDGCSAEHWSEVKAIITDAMECIETPRFAARLVSDADDVGVIQKRIVQGVYSADVIVCDVSGKNPNVMFELGMRLAFDKPTVIIKDDKTDYTFDTGVIEHITYPRDLRFQRIVEFKQLLAQKVLATYNASLRDPDHSTFLKNFGTFKIAHLSEKEASAEQIILDAIGELQREVGSLRRNYLTGSHSINWESLSDRRIVSMDEIESIVKEAESLMAFNSPESANELAAMRGILKHIRELPSLPERLSLRADAILAAVPPRPSPSPARSHFVKASFAAK